jgi:hypothetical protein
LTLRGGREPIPELYGPTVDVRRSRFEADPTDDLVSGSVDDGIVRQRSTLSLTLGLEELKVLFRALEGVGKRNPFGHPSCYGVVV